MYTLRCFGRVAIQGPEGDETRLRSRKHLALLLYLAANRRRDHSRQDLAALFWSSEPDRARHSLSQALYDIRSQLPEASLDSGMHDVRLRDNGVVLQSEVFELAVREGELRRAVDLYAGEFAPRLERAGTDAFERWVDQERVRLARLAEIVLLQHVHECEARGRWGEMCVSSLRLLEMNPLNQEVHRAHMRGLWLQGDREAALRHFRENEEFLEREVPGGITAETRDLVARIEAGRPLRSRSAVEEPLVASMVGREREFGQLKEALGRLVEGEGGMVLVRGEAGIGKTRLLDEFAEVAALDDCTVLRSRCYYEESEVPYGPVREGLSALLEDDGDSTLTRNASYHQLGHLLPHRFGQPADDGGVLASADAGRRRLYEEVADLIRSATARGPVVWLVDDAQWIDETSASLFRYIVRRLSSHPFLLVMATRLHDTGGRNLERRLLGDAAADGLSPRMVDLSPLSAPAMSELVEEARGGTVTARSVDSLHRLSGGNPFFALECLQAPGGDRVLKEFPSLDGRSRYLTDRSRSLLALRIEGISEDARRVLESTAVAGRHATYSLVGRVSGLSVVSLTEAARELYAAGLIQDVEGEDRLEFRHDITREYVYREMGGLQRAALHLTVGEILSEESREVESGTLARHFREAGDYHRAYQHAAEAAGHAAERHAHEDAKKLASIALPVAETREERGRCLKILAKAEMALSQLAAAQSHFEDLLALDVLSKHEAVAVRLDTAIAHLELAEWTSALGQLDTVEGDLDRLEERGSAHCVARAHMLYLKLKIAIRQNDMEMGNKVLEVLNALSVSEVGSPDNSHLQALVAASRGGYATFTHSSQKAETYLSEAASLSENCPLDLRLNILLLHSMASYRLGKWDEAEQQNLTILNIARAHNDTFFEILALGNIAACSLSRGEWDRVREITETIENLRSTLPHRLYSRVSAEMNRAAALFFSGSPREAGAIYRELLKFVEDNTAQAYIPDIQACLGLIALETGDLPAAEHYREKLVGARPEILKGVQNRYKIYWFLASMRWRDNREEAVELLEQRAQDEKETDVGSSAQLRWLAQLFGGVAEQRGLQNDSLSLTDTDAAQCLRELEMGWFIYFSRRWLRKMSYS